MAVLFSCFSDQRYWALISYIEYMSQLVLVEVASMYHMLYIMMRSTSLLRDNPTCNGRNGSLQCQIIAAWHTATILDHPHATLPAASSPAREKYVADYNCSPRCRHLLVGIEKQWVCSSRGIGDRSNFDQWSLPRL
jgi:hypothetical protein